ncbi:hypothetical protein ES708_08664 [subsurface metagenome]
MPEEQEILVKPHVVAEGKAEEEPTKEGFSCKLDSFEPKICSSEPTLVLFLGKKAEGTDEIVQALFSRQDALDVNTGVLDMNDDTCEGLSEKYKIDRDETQLVLFKACEKKGAVSLSAENANEQMDKMKEMIGEQSGS